MTRPSSYVPATSVIDPTAAGGVEALLAFHRARFGDATMMTDGDGASGDSGSGDGAGDAGQGDGAGDAGDGQGADGASEAENVEQLPAWAQKVIRDTRSEAAGHRTRANDAATTAQANVLGQIAQALGLKGDGDSAPTVESLTEQLATATTTTEQATSTARAAQIELAVYRGASAHQGNPDALLDSRAFLAKVSDLDPTSGDFQTKVTNAIKAAVAENPNLKTAQAAARSGNDFTGGTGEGNNRTPKSLTDAVASAYGNQ